MSTKERDEEIIKLLEESPSQFVSVPSLAEYFKTSESTIRRDLQRMANQHLLMRVHGGAASLHFSGNFPNPFPHIRTDAATAGQCR